MSSLNAEPFEHMQATGGNASEPVPACFRYVVKPVESGQTFLFRPNQPNVEQGAEISHRSLGGLYHGKYEKVINNNKARLVWEARLSFVSQCSNRICCGLDC